jgi:hypothetical protein
MQNPKRLSVMQCCDMVILVKQKRQMKNSPNFHQIESLCKKLALQLIKQLSIADFGASFFECGAIQRFQRLFGYIKKVQLPQIHTEYNMLYFWVFY